MLIRLPCIIARIVVALVTVIVTIGTRVAIGSISVVIGDLVESIEVAGGVSKTHERIYNRQIYFSQA